MVEENGSLVDCTLLYDESARVLKATEQPAVVSIPRTMSLMVSI